MVAAVYAGHGFDFVESRLMALRFELLSRAADSTITVVAIDPQSLHELKAWPWPRRYHAKVARWLAGAGAEQIAFAVDFSSTASESDDKSLAAAFRAIVQGGGRRVILPVFQQFSAFASPQPRMLFTSALAALAEWTEPAFTNVHPDADGLVRQMATAEVWQGRRIPTLPARLAGFDGRDDYLFYVDFGIDPKSVSVVSYADVLAGRADPAAFKGRKVIVGATAAELGDQLAVPVYSALPGPIFEALAYESLVQDRAIQRVAVLPILVVTFLVSMFGGAVFRARSWPAGVVILTGGSAGALALSLAVQWAVPVSLDVVPWIAAAVAAFLVELVREVKDQTLRAFISGMAAAHTRAVLRDLIENSLDAIVLVEPSGAIAMFNPAAARLFRRRVDDAVGRDLSVLFPDAAAPGDGTPLMTPGLRERTITRADGSILPVEISVNETLLRLSRRAVERRTFDRGAQILIIRDISARRAAAEKEHELYEQLAHASRLATMGEMAAGFAHELNQPLTAIINYAFGILRRLRSGGGATEELSGTIEEIAHQAHRADDILRGIRQLVRKEDSEKSAIAVNEAVAEVAKLLTADLRAHEVDLQIELDHDLPTAYADTVQVQQVVLNLARNAIEAMPEESPRERRVVISTAPAGKDFIEVSVRDTGVGIPRDRLSRLFEPFYTTKPTGMGIGLLVCRSIVENHGGRLRVSSVENEGTTMAFTLPLTEAAANPTARRTVA